MLYYSAAGGHTPSSPAFTIVTICSGHGADSADRSADLKCDDEAWWGAIAGSLLVGAVGVLPLFLLSFGNGVAESGESGGLRVMLGCACGGLLGNTFLHLLPESYANINAILMQNEGNGKQPITFLGMFEVTSDPHGFNGDMYIGLWVLAGIVAFIMLEKSRKRSSASGSESSSSKPTPATPSRRPSTLTRGSPGGGSNNAVVDRSPATSGYLNLLVNTLDNFTHGLAIAAAFCNSQATGITTTIAIVIHEVPHEVGDYAILIKSGFSKLNAITAQFMTSAGGLLGAIYGLSSSEAEAGALWIYPFAGGGFIYIALVSLIPDMMQDETSTMPWWRDVLHIMLGAVIVGTVTSFHDAFEHSEL
eukprot:gene2177-34388_t